mmetsp:Transcript_3881/g.3665  ORF Transcript_3881/g.3665 Transcript_3881/m.3665 type:complete len:127 (+) Transcript_3881:309-689(+)
MEIMMLTMVERMQMSCSKNGIEDVDGYARMGCSSAGMNEKKRNQGNIALDAARRYSFAVLKYLNLPSSDVDLDLDFGIDIDISLLTGLDMHEATVRVNRNCHLYYHLHCQYVPPISQDYFDREGFL